MTYVFYGVLTLGTIGVMLLYNTFITKGVFRYEKKQSLHI